MDDSYFCALVVSYKTRIHPQPPETNQNHPQPAKRIQ